MRIVFAGTPEFAVPSLRSLAAQEEHRVVGVLTREDAPLGRKRVLTPSPVARAAEELGLPVHRANRLDAAATDWAREREPDLGVIVAYGGLVREPLLGLPDHGWINLHFSELPHWRGAAPVQRALIAGERRIGVTVFRLVAELDAGDVLARDAWAVAPGTSAGETLTRLADAGTQTILRAIAELEADPAAGEPQRGEPSYAHKLTREDGRLDPLGAAATALDRWAGTSPEPGAWVTLAAEPGGEAVGAVLKLRELAVPADGAPIPDVPAGIAILHEGRALLRFADGALELRSVQPAGKPAMSGADWLRGRGGRAVLA